MDVLGFGRILKHEDCHEFCTLGVIEPDRYKGIGKILVMAIIKASTQPLYLACIIPDYFIPFDFKIVENYPLALHDKLAYCNNELSVEKPYVIMKHSPL